MWNMTASLVGLILNRLQTRQRSHDCEHRWPLQRYRSHRGTEAAYNDRVTEPWADGGREREVPLCPWSHQWVTAHSIPRLQTHTHQNTDANDMLGNIVRGKPETGKTEQTRQTITDESPIKMDAVSTSPFVSCFSVSDRLSFIYIINRHVNGDRQRWKLDRWRTINIRLSLAGEVFTDPSKRRWWRPESSFTLKGSR